MLAVAGAALLLIVPAAAAQSQPASDSLKGPAVKENRAPGAEGRFGAGGGPGFKNTKGEREGPGGGREMMRAYHQAFGAVLGDDASENVRATETQREQIKKIFSDFGTEARAYMQQHKDELQGMRPKRGEARQGDEADAARKANRDKVEAIMQGAPKPKDAFNKAWAVLNPEQQTAVKARLDQAQERMSERRKDDYVRRHLNRGKGAGAADRQGPGGPPQGPDARRRGPRPEGKPGADTSAMSPEQRERLAERLKNLSPEQQEQLLRRLEHRRAGDGADQPGRGGRGGRDGRGQRKAPPPMDDVQVPPAPKHDEPMTEPSDRD